MLIDPAALLRIQSMELRAKVVVEGFMNGLHRSPFHGFSVEFSEYRAYAPGDDIRHLDWKVLARSDKRFIKKYEDETNLRCLLCVDQSRSMAFGDKAAYAATLAATFGYFLIGQGDAVGLATFDADITDYLPVRSRLGHLRQLMLRLERPATGTATDFGAPLQKIAEMQTRRGMFLLVSDLLAPIDTLKERLGVLRARGHEVAVWQILDPREVTFDFDNAAQFVDLESGERMFIEPGAARESYRAAMADHGAAIDRLCGELGIPCVRLTTDQTFDAALHGFLQVRERTGRDGAVRTNRR